MLPFSKLDTTAIYFHKEGNTSLITCVGWASIEILGRDPDERLKGYTASIFKMSIWFKWMLRGLGRKEMCRLYEKSVGPVAQSV